MFILLIVSKIFNIFYQLVISHHFSKFSQGIFKTRKTLKERLECLIQSNVKLESKAKMGEEAILIVRRDHEKEIKKIKTFYEGEMCEARRLLNDQAEQCGR